MAELCWRDEGDKADAQSFGGGVGDSAFSVATWNADSTPNFRRLGREERQAGQSGAGCDGAGPGWTSVAEDEECRAPGAGGRVFSWTSGCGYDDVFRVPPMARS